MDVAHLVILCISSLYFDNSGLGTFLKQFLLFLAANKTKIAKYNKRKNYQKQKAD